MWEKIKKWFTNFPMAEPPKKIGKSVLVMVSLTQQQERILKDIFADPVPKPPTKIFYRGYVYRIYGEENFKDLETSERTLDLDLFSSTLFTHYKV